MSKRIDEEFLRSKGFTQSPDGSWGKEDRPRCDPPSRPDTQLSEGQPKRRKRAPSTAAPDVRFVAIVTVKTVRPRDYDGLGAASKHYLDGLRLCGLFPDDSPDHFECLAVAERVRHFREEETIIEIFQVSAEMTGQDEKPE
jgi:hypothetical protein